MKLTLTQQLAAANARIAELEGTLSAALAKMDTLQRFNEAMQTKMRAINGKRPDTSVSKAQIARDLAASTGLDVRIIGANVIAPDGKVLHTFA
jgi:hypothetical protein